MPGPPHAVFILFMTPYSTSRGKFILSFYPRQFIGTPIEQVPHMLLEEV